ncbi:olfactory receptor 6N1-like [Leptodactylus fuscus]|uniref:olfactory receptor 6N1-like n=1 Tax=Leptodactylus fuscus TaxID=238119 RepID=UPI003F4E8A56
MSSCTGPRGRKWRTDFQDITERWLKVLLVLSTRLTYELSGAYTYVRIHGRRTDLLPPSPSQRTKMEIFNHTSVNGFTLLSFSALQHLQILLFILILLTYVICVVGNSAIIAIVQLELSLHTPMYLYISTFAALEIVFVSSTVPNLLSNLVLSEKKISFIGCFTQLYVFNSLGVTECYLLAIMVFDRHLAINSPLRYPSIMTNQFCIKLAIVPWLVGFLIVLAPTIITARLQFCGPHEINHFLCDFAPLQSLACSIPVYVIVLTSSVAFIDVVVPFIIILGLYIRIIITVLKIRSGEGKKKAFSTCSSHLIVASLFYGTATIVYVKPNGSQYDKFLALMYTAVTPLVNPFIYTFRNRDVKNVFRRYLGYLVKQQ